MVQLEKEGQAEYGVKPYSEATAAKIDEAVKKILDEAHKQAIQIVEDNRDKHKLIAEALLKYETLNEKQIMALYKTGEMPEADQKEFPSESKASTYEEAKAAMEKKEHQKDSEKIDSDDSSKSKVAGENSENDITEEKTSVDANDEKTPEKPTDSENQD